MDIRKYWDFVVATVVVLGIILAAIHVQYSSVDGLGDVSGTLVAEQGFRAAASFHVLNQEDDFGVTQRNELSSKIVRFNGYCGMDEPGLSDPGYRLQFEPVILDEPCNKVFRYVRVPITFQVSDQTLQGSMLVGSP